MSEYSRPLGNAVRLARSKMGLTQKQVGELIDADERTVMSIENYKSNTTMEILYPLIRELRIDPRDIFNPEKEKESLSHYQLRVLIDNCTEDEAATLISVCNAVLCALRNKDAAPV